jgi:hypothetical protein
MRARRQSVHMRGTRGKVGRYRMHTIYWCGLSEPMCTEGNYLRKGAHRLRGLRKGCAGAKIALAHSKAGDQVTRHRTCICILIRHQAKCDDGECILGASRCPARATALAAGRDKQRKAASQNKPWSNQPRGLGAWAGAQPPCSPCRLNQPVDTHGTMSQRQQWGLGAPWCASGAHIHQSITH